ncbi:MAG TPA: urease accessory protein UreD [Segeticoccus sp.]|uniref:urease accessory protein UreD n=1 Tax=Segeticoccus sp. TaxID=2706531 RepID=UPI002D80A0CD|nr:urease accessory protein UreD [Segeticoccus sp.]HET8601604.1 urease accessory protein UreD [Segeticoccus sp.]
MTRAAERHEPRWWTAPRVPAAVRAFDDEDGRRRGSVGLLDMEFAVVAGATRAVRHFHQTPLYVLQPIHLDAARPDMAFVYLQQQGDGLLQGDRCRVDVEVGEAAAVHLTTQAATKLYGMETGYASQLVNITAAAGAFVEYLPEPVIPFRHSRFLGRLTVTAHPQSIVLFGDILLPGRVSHGEWHDYDVYHASTRVQRPHGRQLALDTLSFEGTGARADTPARLGRHGVHAAFFALAPPDRADGLASALRDRLEQCPDVVAGVTALPFASGLVVRLLGPTSIPVRHAVGLAWDTARRHLVGCPAPDLRRD